MALVGIARLAAESQLLEAKRTVEYFEIAARSILNRTKPNMPFQWTINPYRGCEIGCKYCYARYAHEFMELDPQSFEEKIYAKPAPAFVLRLDTVRKLRAAGVCVSVFPNPIMPGITDSEKSLDAVARAAKDAGAMSFGGGPLFLPGAAQQIFLPFIEREFPHLAARYRETYEKGIHLSRRYKDALAGKVRRIRERHGLTSGAVEYRPELWVEEEQMALPLEAAP